MKYLASAATYPYPRRLPAEANYSCPIAPDTLHVLGGWLLNIIYVPPMFILLLASSISISCCSLIAPLPWKAEGYRVGTLAYLFLKSEDVRFICRLFSLKAAFDYIKESH